MSFQFVENGNIDGTTRKLIRSHVMRGKNVGRLKPQRLNKSSSVQVIAPKFPQDLSRDFRIYDDSSNHSIPRTPGSLISSYAFPYDMQPYGSLEKLIYQCKPKYSSKPSETLF
jgi:hypothetical protein